MDLHLTPDPHDRGVVRLFVHGALVAEYSAGLTQDRDSLVAEVTAARAAQALEREVRAWARWLMAPVPAREQAERARGRDDGLLNATVMHPYPGVPPIPPEHSTAYLKGYEQGQALRRCLEVMAEAEQEEGKV